MLPQESQSYNGDLCYEVWLNGKQPLLMFIVSQKSIVGLVGHLKGHFPAMHRLYMVLKDCTEPLTDDQLAMPLAEKVLDTEAANTYLG